MRHLVCALAATFAALAGCAHEGEPRSSYLPSALIEPDLPTTPDGRPKSTGAARWQ